MSSCDGKGENVLAALRVLKGRKAILVVVLVALIAAACAGDDTDTEAGAEADGELTTIRYAFDWIECEANRAVHFAAEEQGFYEDEGVIVETTDAEGSGAALPLIGAGEQDMGQVQAPVAVLGKAEELPVTAVGVHMTESPVIILADGSLEDPQDLEGLEIAIQVGQFEEAVWQAWTREVGLDRDEIDENPAGGQAFTLFLDHRVDGFAWYFATPATLTLTEGREGEETLFFVRDVLDMYGLSIVVNNDFLEENPDAVRGFLRAYIRGIKYVIDNPTESIDLLMERCPPQQGYDRVAQEWNLDRLVEFWTSEPGKTEGLLSFEAEGWESTKDVLVEGGLMEDVEIIDLYTTEFLPDPPILP